MFAKSCLGKIPLIFASVMFFNFWVGGPVKAQVVTPNSKRFVVDGFYDFSFNNKGYEKYRLNGFYEKPTQTSKGRLTVLPHFFVTPSDIKYIDKSGREYEHSADKNKKTSSIIIQARTRQALPSGIQRIGVAAALAGTSLKEVGLNVLPLPQGLQIRQDMMAKIFNLHNLQNNSLRALVASANNELSKYAIEVAAVNEVELEVVVANETVGSCKFNGTLISSGNRLPAVEVLNPNQVIKNRISQSNFTLNLFYRFNDSKTTSLEAVVDAKKITTDFITESHRSLQSSSSSGFRIFGIGTKRKTIRERFEEELRTSSRSENLAGTYIVSNDASSDMFDRFESSFFPSLTKLKVVENHVAAYHKAKSAGKTALANAHKQYAKMIGRNDVDLEVDTAKALAALSSSDYAGFLSSGVRFGSSQFSGNGKFRRVGYGSSSATDKKVWSEVQRHAVQREINFVFRVGEVEKQKPWMGILAEAFPGVSGLIVTGVVDGGPGHRAGITPGLLIKAVDYNLVSKPKDLEDSLNSKKVGDTIDIDVVYPSGKPPETLEVELWKGVPNNK